MKKCPIFIFLSNRFKSKSQANHLKKSDFIIYINIMWSEAVMDILFGSFEDVNEVGNKERNNFDVN